MAACPPRFPPFRFLLPDRWAPPLPLGAPSPPPPSTRCNNGPTRTNTVPARRVVVSSDDDAFEDSVPPPSWPVSPVTSPVSPHRGGIMSPSAPMSHLSDLSASIPPGDRVQDAVAAATSGGSTTQEDTKTSPHPPSASPPLELPMGSMGQSERKPHGESSAEYYTAESSPTQHLLLDEIAASQKALGLVVNHAAASLGSPTQSTPAEGSLTQPAVPLIQSPSRDSLNDESPTQYEDGNQEDGSLTQDDFHPLAALVSTQTQERDLEPTPSPPLTVIEPPPAPLSPIVSPERDSQPQSPTDPTKIALSPPRDELCLPCAPPYQEVSINPRPGSAIGSMILTAADDNMAVLSSATSLESLDEDEKSEQTDSDASQSGEVVPPVDIWDIPSTQNATHIPSFAPPPTSSRRSSRKRVISPSITPNDSKADGQDDDETPSRPPATKRRRRAATATADLSQIPASTPAPTSSAPKKTARKSAPVRASSVAVLGDVTNERASRRSSAASARSRMAVLAQPNAKRLSDSEFFRAVQKSKSDYVIILSNYTPDARKKVTAALRKLSDVVHARQGLVVEVVDADDWVETCTHVVSDLDENRCVPRTRKLLGACVTGAWVVSTEWVHACLAAGAMVDEMPYEALGDRISGITQGPRRNRLRVLKERGVAVEDMSIPIRPFADAQLYLCPSVASLADFLDRHLPLLGAQCTKLRAATVSGGLPRLPKGAAPSLRDDIVKVRSTNGGQHVYVRYDITKPIVVVRAPPQADKDGGKEGPSNHRASPSTKALAALASYQVIPLPTLLRCIASCIPLGDQSSDGLGLEIRPGDEAAVVAAVYGVQV